MKTPKDSGKPYCYMPNAAIGWKQPNGFYYPPANHSANLYFQDVDVRHFVVSPLFKEGTLTPDNAEMAINYCQWSINLFNGFAGNDRQTVLNDDDGTLTGYRKSTVINLENFFVTPVEAVQCLSADTSRTSPYEYVTTVVYPQCVSEGKCALDPSPNAPPNPDLNFNSGDWNRACTDQNCYGVPLWRQDLMKIADGTTDRSIRMMGQQTGQRSTLTVNHGTYYLDTTVGLNAQKNCPDGAAQCAVNVFKPGGTYYLFLIYAKDSTEQTYRFYVGDPGFLPSSIELVQANLHKNPVAFGPVGSGTKPSKVDWYKGDKTTGVIEVVIKSADIPDWAAQIATVKKNTCQPSSYCHYDEAAGCVDNSGSGAVCRWAIADQDCPDKGCIGIKFKLPDTFKTDPPNQVRPPAVCVPKAAPWDVSLDAIKVPSGVCPLPADVLAADFCPAK